MHVLRMTRIDHRYHIPLYCIGVVPLVGVRHMVASPSAKGRLATRQRTLYGVYGEEGIAHVSFHILIRVGVAILFGHVFVE